MTKFIGWWLMNNRSFMDSAVMIKSFNFSSLSNWSVQYLLESAFRYSDKFELVPIGTFLKRNKTPIDIDDQKDYKRVTIKINNGGIYLRDIENGKRIGTKKQFLISKGQFLLSKIDARNGAFGVVPEEVDGAIITGNFWTFDVDYSVVNPYFLSLITTTPEFIRFCENASNGTTNRHYLQEELFLTQSIPLPTLSDQNKIVDSYNKKIKEAEEQENRAKELELNIERYLFDELGIKEKFQSQKSGGLNFVSYQDTNVWGTDRLLRGGNNSVLLSSIYPNKKLSEVAFINPRTTLLNLKDDDAMSFIPMECVSDEYGEVIELRKGRKADSKGYTKFQEGDLIWARITPCMQNGKSAIVKSLTNGVGYGSTEYHVIREKDPTFNIQYAHTLLRRSVILHDAVNYFTGSAGQQRVPKSYLENLEIPVPPISKQIEVSEAISTMIKQMKQLQESAASNRKQAIREFEYEIFEI